MLNTRSKNNSIVIIEIDYPKTSAGKRLWSREYGLNSIYSGKHWAKRQKDSQFWHTLVHSKLDEMGIKKEPFDNPVSISFYWNSRLDLDNEAYKRKLIIDSLKGYLIKDDNKRYVKALHDYPFDENFIRIVVEEVGNVVHKDRPKNT